MTSQAVPRYCHASLDSCGRGVCASQSPELQSKIDNYDPSLFEGEPDAPAEPDILDSLLDGVLPGTDGFFEGAAGGAAQQSYMLDILPEGPDDE